MKRWITIGWLLLTGWISAQPAGGLSTGSGLYPILMKAKYGYIDRTGKTVIPPRYVQGSRFSEGRAVVQVHDHPPHASGCQPADLTP